MPLLCCDLEGLIGPSPVGHRVCKDVLTTGSSYQVLTHSSVVRTVVLKLDSASRSPRGLVKMLIAGPHS